MGTPKTPNTGAATETNKRRGDETAATRLREKGWLVVPPEHLPDGRGTVDYLKVGDTTTYVLPD